MTASPPRLTLIDWLLLSTLSVIWGSSFLFNRIAVMELPPFTIVLARVAIAAGALHIVLRIAGVRFPTDGASWRAFFGMGLLNNAIPFSLIVWGQIHIASGLASILNATTPLFTVIVAHFLTQDEKLTRNRVVGILVGLAGVVVLIGPQALAGLGNDVLAQLAVLAAALSYSFAGIWGRRFKRMGIPPLATAAGQVTASTCLLLPVALIVDQPWALPVPSMLATGAILGHGLLCTALAYLLFFRVLASAGAVNLSLVTLLIPPSAILMGVVWLHERLEMTDLAGMALIGLGLIAIDGRLLARTRSAAEGRTP